MLDPRAPSHALRGAQTQPTREKDCAVAESAKSHSRPPMHPQSAPAQTSIVASPVATFADQERASGAEEPAVGGGETKNGEGAPQTRAGEDGSAPIVHVPGTAVAKSHGIGNLPEECAVTSQGEEAEEKASGDVGDDAPMEGLALWLHHANKMFAKKPATQISETCSDRQKELTLRGSSARMGAGVHNSDVAGSGLVGVNERGVGASTPGTHTRPASRSSSSTPHTSPTLSAYSSPVGATHLPSPSNAHKPPTGPPAQGHLGKNPLVTFIGSTQTVSVTRREKTGSPQGSRSLSIATIGADKGLAAGGGAEAASDPGSSLQCTPQETGRAEVQSLLTFAAGLFASPPVHTHLVDGDADLGQQGAAAMAEIEDVWEERVIPKWEETKNDGQVRALWQLGLPPRVRGRVWQLAIGNELELKQQDYTRCLAMAKFVAGSNFQASGPDTRRRRLSARARRQASNERARDSLAQGAEACIVEGPGSPPRTRSAPGVGLDTPSASLAHAVSPLDEERYSVGAEMERTFRGGGEGGSLHTPRLCRELPRMQEDAKEEVVEKQPCQSTMAVGHAGAYYTMAADNTRLVHGAQCRQGDGGESDSMVGAGVEGERAAQDRPQQGEKSLADGQSQAPAMAAAAQACAAQGNVPTYASGATGGGLPQHVSCGSKTDSRVGFGKCAGDSESNFAVEVEEPWIDKATIRQIDLDLDRTYTDLGLFGSDGPYQDALRDLLLAYSCFRPSVGYVQGMGYLASTLLLYMEPERAFVCMGNLLHKHHFPDFLLVDMEQIDLYAAAFNKVFAKELPALYRHLTSIGVDCRLYLVEWWMTVFCTVLPLSASSVVWDLLLLEGVSAIVRITVGVLAVLEKDLLGASLDACLTLLTHAEDWFDVATQGASGNGGDGDAGADGEMEEDACSGRLGSVAVPSESKSFAAVMEAAGTVLFVIVCVCVCVCVSARARVFVCPGEVPAWVAAHAPVPFSLALSSRAKHGIRVRSGLARATESCRPVGC